MYLSNLGSALRDRFERTVDLPDLEQAIATGQAAVRATPADHPTEPCTCPTSGSRCRTGSSGPGTKQTWCGGVRFDGGVGCGFGAAFGPYPGSMVGSRARRTI